MKIAVCDDETRFIDAICPLLEQWAEQHDIVLTLYRFTNGDDLIAAHWNECMDFIILDVIMPLLNGMDTAREIRNHDAAVPIVFLSSSRDFAVDSYEIKALHYLMKPVDAAKLFSILDDFLRSFIHAQNTFVAQTAIGFCKIIIADVAYLEAQNKLVLVHFTNGKSLEIREKISKCEEVFSPQNGFCRCHRSYIVNLSHVEAFSRTQLLSSHKAEIPISRNSYAAFKKAYFKHVFE